MMQKLYLRITSLIMLALIAVSCFCSCGNGSAIAEKIETSPIPSGFTFGDLCGILYIYGHQVVLPCEMEDIAALDERITLDPEYSAQLTYTTNVRASSMYSKGYDEMGSSYYNSIMFTAMDEIHKNELFSINGDTGFGAGMDEMRELLGEPTGYEQDLGTLKYTFTEGDEVMRIWFSFDEDGELYFLTLIYTKWERK